MMVLYRSNNRCTGQVDMLTLEHWASDQVDMLTLDHWASDQVDMLTLDHWASDQVDMLTLDHWASDQVDMLTLDHCDAVISRFGSCEFDAQPLLLASNSEHCRTTDHFVCCQKLLLVTSFNWSNSEGVGLLNRNQN